MAARGERLRGGLRAALKGNKHVTEVRGLGLITGIQMDQVGVKTGLCLRLVSLMRVFSWWVRSFGLWVHADEANSERSAFGCMLMRSSMTV